MRLRWLMAVLSVLALAAPLSAQHLWWDLGGQSHATCLYGEITVWDTSTTIYYCGANWHPGEPAGGYCGIQHNSDVKRVTIFSIWDTSTWLHPSVTFAGPDVIHSRFGGEGSGSHTHLPWPWKVGETFRFFVRKRSGFSSATTDCSYYVFDPQTHHWLHVATITSPNGDEKSVGTFGGAIASFLENWSGQKRDIAKLASYNLWLGDDPDHMKRLVHAGGDGKWGELGDSYCLAEGTPENLATAIANLPTAAGTVAWGNVGAKLPDLADKPIPPQALPLP